MKMLELQDKVNLGKFKNTFHLAVYKVTFCYMHKWVRLLYELVFK